MNNTDDISYHSRQDNVSDDCARSRRVARAHTPHEMLGGEESGGSSAPTGGPQFFTEHGVSTKVAEGRSYAWYEKGDPERIVREAWPNNPQWASRVANQDSGLVIPRYAPVSLGLPHVPAELRPDSAIVTGSHWHYHGDDVHLELVIPSTGNPLPRKWVHDPSTMTTHIENVHGGENNQTVHLDENRAKYVFLPGDGAKRLDLHPQMWNRFTTASRVFFGIEGCIKADAMLSAGEAVFSVPSVTLWDAPELDNFIRYLVGKTVYIVPDADWHSNSAVMTQAMFCRTYLRNKGVTDTHVASSPYQLYLDTQNDEHPVKAVDDFLWYGGTMSELEVLERETGYGLAEFLAERRTWRQTKVVRGAEVLENLALHADTKGQIRASLRKVAKVMGCHHSRVQRGLRDLEACGAVHIDGDLSTYARHYDRENKRYVGWEWRDRPAITITPELRARDSIRLLGG